MITLSSAVKGFTSRLPGAVLTSRLQIGASVTQPELAPEYPQREIFADERDEKRNQGWRHCLEGLRLPGWIPRPLRSRGAYGQPVSAGHGLRSVKEKGTRRATDAPHEKVRRSGLRDYLGEALAEFPNFPLGRGGWARQGRPLRRRLLPRGGHCAPACCEGVAVVIFRATVSDGAVPTSDVWRDYAVAIMAVPTWRKC